MKPGFKSILLDVLHYWLIISFAAAAFYVVFPKYQTHDSYRLNRITGQIVSLEEAQRQDNLFENLTAMFDFENYLHRRSTGPVTHQTEWTRIVDRSAVDPETISATRFIRSHR